MNSKEYATASSQRTISFTKIDDRTLEATQRINGQVWQVERMTFSVDGQTRTVVRKGSNGVSELTRTTKRSGGTSDPVVPLLGRWENDWSTATGTSPILTIQVIFDSIRVSGRDIYEAAFDGKEYAVERSPDADTVTLRRLDERTIEQTLKAKGMLVHVTFLAVSSDGNTLTINVRRQNNTMTRVFTRQ